MERKKKKNWGGGGRAVNKGQRPGMFPRRRGKKEHWNEFKEPGRKREMPPFF